MAESVVPGSFFCDEFFLLVILSSAEWLYEQAESKISTMTQVKYTLVDSEEVRDQKIKEKEEQDRKKKNRTK